MAALSMSWGCPWRLHDLSDCLYGIGYICAAANNNSGAGLGVIFLVTGLLGFGLGPVISMWQRATVLKW